MENIIGNTQQGLITCPKCGSVNLSQDKDNRNKLKCTNCSTSTDISILKDNAVKNAKIIIDELVKQFL